MMKVVLMCLLGSITAIPVPVVEEMQPRSSRRSGALPETWKEKTQHLVHRYLSSFWRKTTQKSPEVDAIPTVPTAGKLAADGPTEVGHFSPSPSPSESSTVKALDSAEALRQQRHSDGCCRLWRPTCWCRPRSWTQQQEVKPADGGFNAPTHPENLLCDDGADAADAADAADGSFNEPSSAPTVIESPAALKIENADCAAAGLPAGPQRHPAGAQKQNEAFRELRGRRGGI
ncbi:hypothetical protein AOLI_G00153040 [Acnodon oligacanthus]